MTVQGNDYPADFMLFKKICNSLLLCKAEDMAVWLGWPVFVVPEPDEGKEAPNADVVFWNFVLEQVAPKDFSQYELVLRALD